jgi:hypothetical protein
MKTLNKYIIFAALLVLASCGGGGGSSGSNYRTPGDDFDDFASPAELEVGDVMKISFESGNQADLSFDSVVDNAQFILAVGVIDEMKISHSIQVTDSGLPDVVRDTSSSYSEKSILPDDLLMAPTDVLNATLREAETDMSVMTPSPYASASKAYGGKATEGDDKAFNVFTNIRNVAEYTTISTRAECVTSSLEVYVDVRVTADMLSDEDVDQLCNEYNDVITDEINLFGELSDVDDNDRLQVVMTPAINELGGAYGGIIIGYFYAGDLYNPGGSNPASNDGETIYILVPDPDGDYGPSISKEFAMSSLLLSVFPHEVQHAISYNQHVFERGGAPEEIWLNEGLSHLAEDLFGYNTENPSRYAIYLRSPSTASLVTPYAVGLAERGASYLFLRYLYDIVADPSALVANLVSSDKTGIENVEYSVKVSDYERPFEILVARWMATLASSGEDWGIDPRYRYLDRTRHAKTNNWMGVTLQGSSNNVRGTMLSGIATTDYAGASLIDVIGTTARFFALNALPDTLTIQGGEGDGTFGVLIRTN